MRNSWRLLSQILSALILTVLFTTAWAGSANEKFVYIYDYQGNLLTPLNAASACPNPDEGTAKASVCHGIAVDSDGHYSARLASNTIGDQNLIFVANEYQVITTGSNSNTQTKYVLLESKRRVDKVLKDITNDGVNINRVAEATIKAIEKVHKIPQDKIGKINHLLSGKCAELNAEDLNHSMANDKDDNKTPAQNNKHQHDLILANQEKFDASEEQILVDLATIAVQNSADPITQAYIRKTITQALLQPESLQDIANQVFAHISALQNVSADSAVILLDADKYFVYLDETSQLTTDNSINANNFFAYTWEGVQSILSSASFVKSATGSYLVCVTGEINSGNDSSTDCIRMAVKDVVEAIARAGARRIGTGNTMLLSGSLSVGASSYAWSGAGTFTNTSAAQTTWTAPDVPGTYDIQLIINNGASSDSVRVNVFAVVPVAIAQASVEYVYILDGSASVDFASGSIATDGSAVDSLSWSIVEQPLGSQASLSSATANTTKLTADSAGIYTLQLIATKGENSASTQVSVQVRRADAPVADAGPDKITFRNQAVTLNASGSYAPPGKSLIYQWQANTGVITAPSSSQTTYTATALGEFELTLNVTDGLLSASDSLNVSVRNRTPSAKDDLVLHDMKEVYLGKLPASDADGDPLNYTLITETSSGSVTIDKSTGDYVYLPGGDKGCKFHPDHQPTPNNSGGVDVPVIKLCADKTTVAAGEVVTLTTSNSINAAKFSGFSWNVDVTAVDLTTYKFASTVTGSHHICITGHIGQSANTSTACIDVIVSGSLDWGTCGIDHTDLGLLGGHFDVDTADFIATTNNGGISKHTHEYDDKFNVNGIDAFTMRDNHKTLGGTIDPKQKFKLIIANADLSTGARITVNNSYFGPDGSTYELATDYDNTDLVNLPIYSISGVNGTTKLDSLEINFDKLAIINQQLHATNATDVMHNVPGKLGEWRNGALVIQAVAVNDDGSDAFSTDMAKSNGGVQGVATTGLLWEVSTYWHWKGPSYHQSGWDSYDPTHDYTSATVNKAALSSDCTDITSGYADSFQYQVNDGYASSPVRTIWFNVGWINSLPEVSDNAVQTVEEQAVSGTLSVTDIDAQTHSFRIIDNGTLGTAVFTNATTGAFTYTPNLNASGVDTFTVVANDGYDDSTPATVTVTITNINDVPVAYYAGTLQTVEEVAVTGMLGGLDADNDVLQFMLATIPTKGDVVITNAQTGAFVYTPRLNENGVDNFFFVVHDSEYESNTAQVNIVIDPVNDAPVATDLGPLTTHADEVLTGSLKDSATDVDKDVLIYQVISQSAKGSITLDASSGEFSFTPTGALGSDSFTFVAKDAQLNSNVATVTLNILEPNTAPIADSKEINVIAGVTYGGTLTGNDPDADAISFILDNNGLLGSAQVTTPSSGEFTYTASALSAGTDLFSFKVSDGDKQSSPAEVQVNITSQETVCKGPGSQSQDSDGDGYADFIEVLFNKNIADANSTPAGLTLSDINYSFSLDNDTDGYDDIVELWLKSDFTNTQSLPSDSNLRNIPDCLTPLWDNIPPALMGFSIVTPVVDASSGSAVASFALTAIDNALGVKEIDIKLRSPSGTILEGHSTLAETPIVLFTTFNSDTFSAYAEAGEWTVDALIIRDAKGAELYLSTADLLSRNYATTLTVTNSNSDIAPPAFALNGFQVLTPNVDIAGGATFASFSCDVTDNVAGVARITVTLTSPSGNQVRFGEAIKTGTLLSVSETINTNVFETFMELGTWVVSEVVLTDQAGNSMQYNTAELTALSYATSVLVSNTNSGSDADTLAPDLDNFVVLTPIVDLASSNKSAAFSVSTTDDKSGIQEIAIELTSPSGLVKQLGNFASLNRPLSLVSQRVDMEAFTTSSDLGLWVVSSLLISDGAGNLKTWNQQQLVDLGYAVEVDVRCTNCGFGTHVLYAYTSSVETDEDTSVNAKLNGYDNQNHNLTYSIVNNGSLGQVTITDASTGAFTYTPKPDVHGSDSFSYLVADGWYESNVANITVTINSVPDPTVTADMAITVYKNEVYADILAASDADGEELTYAILTNGSRGTAQFISDKRGNFQYTPNLNELGQDQFTVQISDSNTAAIATISVSIVPDMALTGFEVVTPTVSGLDEYARISCNLTLSKDISAISEALLTLVGPAGEEVGFHAYVTGNTYPFLMTNNVYTPSQALSAGIWTFKNLLIKRQGSIFSEFVLADLVEAGFAATVEVLANTSPTASTTDAFTVTLDGSKQGNLVASDPENDTLTYQIITNGSKGSVTLLDANTGTYQYIPTALGNDSFTFITNDGHSDSKLGIVNVTIVATNNNPVAHDTTVNATQNLAYIGVLTATDPDNSPADFHFSIVSQPSHGSVTVDTTTGEYVYWPQTDFLGSDSFTFKLNDGINDSNVATVTLWVNAPINPPDIQIAVLQNQTYTGNLPTIASSGNSVAYQLLSSPAKGSVVLDSASGAFSYIPSNNALGNDQFLFNIATGGNVSKTAKVTISIISLEQACGTSGIVPNLDTDGDGYVDVVELAFSTAIDDATSTPAGLNATDLGVDYSDDDDSDGFSDHVEVWMNTDPTDSASLPNFAFDACFNALSDGIKPRLIGFDISTPVVDIAAGNAVVSFAMTLLDNASGIKRARVNLLSPSDVFVTTSATYSEYPLLTGLQLDTEVLSEFAESGLWTVSSITIFDEAGNRLDVTTNDLTASGWPSQVQVNNSASDVTAPTLESFTIVSEYVYPGTANDQMIVDLVVSDDASGISSARVDFISLSGTIVSASQTLATNPTQATTIQLTTGVLSQYLEEGVWTVYSVLLVDAAGNSAQVISQVISQNFTTTLQVTNPLSDVTKPVLDAFSIISTEIYPASGDARMRFAVTASDDKAGIEKIRIDITGPADQVFSVWGYFSGSYPLSTTAQINSAVLSTLLQQGTWVVSTIEIFDNAGNRQLVNRQNLVSQGYPLAIMVLY